MWQPNNGLVESMEGLLADWCRSIPHGQWGPTTYLHLGRPSWSTGWRINTYNTLNVVRGGLPASLQPSVSIGAFALRQPVWVSLGLNFVHGSCNHTSVHMYHFLHQPRLATSLPILSSRRIHTVYVHFKWTACQPGDVACVQSGLCSPLQTHSSLPLTLSIIPATVEAA